MGSRGRPSSWKPKPIVLEIPGTGTFEIRAGRPGQETRVYRIVKGIVRQRVRDEPTLRAVATAFRAAVDLHKKQHTRLAYRVPRWITRRILSPIRGGWSRSLDAIGRVATAGVLLAGVLLAGDPFSGEPDERTDDLEG